MDKEQTYVDFYSKHSISPVRQDLSDLDKHFQRREGLYRQCGLHPYCFSGRSVLEVGPGSGHNAVYVASLNPARYLLVDGNAEGIRQVEETFAKFPQFAENVEIRQSLLEELDTAEKFDTVLCEGMIPHSLNFKLLLEQLTAVVNPGGILVITCVDAVSFFSERLRRLLSLKFIDQSWELARKVGVFDKLFSSHLDTLTGMSRKYEDWYIDNLVNPVVRNPYLSITDAIDNLDADFDIISSSPQFLQDTRWYKQLTGTSRQYNKRAQDQYWSYVHNFLDYRFDCEPRSIEDNRTMFQLCADITLCARDYELDGKEEHLQNAIPMLAALGKNIADFAPEHSRLLSDIAKLLKEDSLEETDISGNSDFAAFFGRGQQYISFKKR